MRELANSQEDLQEVAGALWDVKVNLVCSMIEMSRMKLKRKNQLFQYAAKRHRPLDCEQRQSLQMEPLLPPKQSITEPQLPIDSKGPLQSKDAAQPQHMN